MPDTTRSTSRFVHFYRGVEEFYFVNQAGELGYIKSGELRPVKETFPQLGDRTFLKSNPDFVRELERFLRELVDVSTIYLENPPPDLELGYMLPAGERYQWRTSTLVLHKHVLESLKEDHELMIRRGIKEPEEGEQDLARILAVRSIHQGFDELAYHKDAYGRYKYFPALFIVPGSEENQSIRAHSNVRVINLRWREAKSQTPNLSQDLPHHSRELVFSVLRENLTQRGAIDRTQRRAAMA